MEHRQISDIDFNSFGTSVANQVSAMLAYWDKDQVCRFANTAYQHWFGKSQDEMVNKVTLRELLGPLYDKNLPYISGALKGERQTFEREITIPSGETRHTLANYYPDIVNGNTQGFFVHVADITPVKLLEKEIIRASQLEARNKELEQFTYIASHDLQEPLRSVINSVGLLQTEYGHVITGDGKRSLDYIVSSTQRMSEMINDLLHYARIGTAETVSEVNCTKVVAHVINDLEKLLTENHVRVIVGYLPVIRGYAGAIYMLFQNLVANAVKFRKEDIEPVITITCVTTNDAHHFSVADNGIGIEPEFSKKIFLIFQRINSRTKYAGSGIGLAHCKKIVDMHGGNIWVESTLGQGSTFHITIPKL